MFVKNFLEAEALEEISHGGVGEVRSAVIFGPTDFQTNLRFILYMEILPDCSIGYHPHGQGEEIYVILEGHGKLMMGNQCYQVSAGDIILNHVGQAHGLENRSDRPIKLLVFQVMSTAIQ